MHSEEDPGVPAATTEQVRAPVAIGVLLAWDPGEEARVEAVDGVDDEREATAIAGARHEIDICKSKVPRPSLDDLLIGVSILAVGRRAQGAKACGKNRPCFCCERCEDL